VCWGKCAKFHICVGGLVGDFYKKVDTKVNKVSATLKIEFPWTNLHQIKAAHFLGGGGFF
jgi:hypothetical protein